MEETVNGALDLEWVELLKHAKRVGLTIEEIREYLFIVSTRKESADAARSALEIHEKFNR